MFRTLRPYQLVVDLSVAALFFLVAGYLLMPDGMVPGWGWGVTASFVFAVALGMRRLSPGIALVVAWVGAIIQMAMSFGPMTSNAAIFAVLYTCAAYGSRVTYWLGFASSFVGAAVITVYLFVSSYLFVSPVEVSLANLPSAFFVLIAALFALLLSWVTGALVRTALRGRETRQAQQQAEAETAAEHERVRIARDMHDVVGHSLAVVIAQADGARYAAAADPAATTTALTTISTTARAALADVRLLLAQLRHSEGPGPQPTLADVEALYAQVRAAGVELRVEVAPTPAEPPPAGIQLAVYRILQEALTNALRHGAGGAVEVRMSWHPDRVSLEVRNPMARDAAPGAGGHGLIGMRERAQLVGGTLGAATRGDAFVVAATLPIGVVA